MSDQLHLPARPGAPIACDMSTARDTPDERLAEYGELFSHALLRRERGEHHVAFAFTAGARAQVDDLARREAECCPFLEYHVETVGDEARFTITNPASAEAEATLDAFYALPGPGDARTASSSATSASMRRAMSSRVAPTSSTGRSFGSASSQSR